MIIKNTNIMTDWRVTIIKSNIEQAIIESVVKMYNERSEEEKNMSIRQFTDKVLPEKITIQLKKQNNK